MTKRTGPYFGLFLFVLLSCKNKEVIVTAEKRAEIATLYDSSALLYDSDPQRAMEIGKKVLELSSRASYPEGRSMGYTNIGYVHYILGDYPSALDAFLKALDIDIKNNLVAREAAIYNHIGNIYKSLGNYDTALARYKSSHKLAVQRDKPFTLAVRNAAMNLGYVFEKMARPDSADSRTDYSLVDSALKYEMEALDLTGKLPPEKNLNVVYNNLGKIYRLKGNYDSSLLLFDKAIGVSLEINDLRGRAETYIFSAEVYEDKLQYKTALLNLYKGFQLSKDLKYERGELLASHAFSRVYEKMNVFDSALLYSRMEKNIFSDLFGIKKIDSLTALLSDFTTQIHEYEMELERSKHERKYNVGLLAIFSGLGFIFLFLMLLMKIKVRGRWLQIAGVIHVLLVFEFFNQLAHPFVERITGHNVYLIFLCLACIAFPLAYAHYKLEHWVKSKFAIEKNHGSENETSQLLV